MSAYKIIECNVATPEQVIAGLLNVGFSTEQIEVHDTPVHLYGYHSDKRKQTANIVVRQKDVNKTMSGGASNDIGFEHINDRYQAHISQYDSTWWKRAEPQFLQGAAEQRVIAQAKKRGYHVTKTKSGDNIKLQLVKNY